MEKILVSACLLGQKVRYDGGASRLDADLLTRWQNEGRLVAVCPEVAGGLSVPRAAAEIVGGDGGAVLDDAARLQTEAGADVTQAFIAGARHALEVANSQKLRVAILKSKSPSCGSRQIYDGTFSATRRAGRGVTAELLVRHGLWVYHEGQLADAADKIIELEMGDEK